jgi:hypothetical protein
VAFAVPLVLTAPDWTWEIMGGPGEGSHGLHRPHACPGARPERRLARVQVPPGEWDIGDTVGDLNGVHLWHACY